MRKHANKVIKFIFSFFIEHHTQIFPTQFQRKKYNLNKGTPLSSRCANGGRGEIAILNYRFESERGAKTEKNSTTQTFSRGSNV